MRFVLSGAAVCVLTAGSFPGALRHLPLRSCSRRLALYSALAMRSPHSAGRRADFSGRRLLLACSVSTQLLRTASMTEAALTFGIGSIARSVRAGGGDDLIDDCGAVRVARQHPDDLGHQSGSFKRWILNSCGYGSRARMRISPLCSKMTMGLSVMARPFAERSLVQRAALYAENAGVPCESSGAAIETSVIPRHDVIPSG